MRSARAILVCLLLLCPSLLTAAPTRPNDREWNALLTDYHWLESVRKAQPQPPAGATRKQQIQALLTSLQKIEPVYTAFVAKLHEYYTRTADARAAQILAREKIIMGDHYVGLSRYDRAIELYRAALEFEPQNAEAATRIEAAQKRRFVPMSSFAAVKSGMKEEEVKNLVGFPREDWIRQVLQNGRSYTVWIYGKSDGGAAAIYFDNGVVYHTNWNAAAPQQTAQTTEK